jgi:hypothetical protein
MLGDAAAGQDTPEQASERPQPRRDSRRRRTQSQSPLGMLMGGGMGGVGGAASSTSFRPTS